MKKNISINISGIIFHIEEDGYDQLKEYLESINRYFSTFEDSLEIISDIETRIAEIFLSKLKEGGKQVIEKEDVESLIATMGSIKDFQAAEEESTYRMDEEEETQEEGPQVVQEPKRLYRDTKRKLLAGVLSGIAYYFSIDPLWIRLIYMLLFFGVSKLPSIGGVLLLGYIVMWIIIPPSDDLVEKKKIKKMYRDPDNKVLGGVSGGIAAYFGIDVVIVRLLFFISIFFAGTGLILYILLWIILPEAKTLTDKMEMQGQPVTLSSIESNIKKSLKVEEGEENIFVKIFLFPFRLIAALFGFLSKALGPFMLFLVEAIRVIFGVILTLAGLSGILAILITSGIMIGLFAGSDLNVLYPLEVIKNDVGLISGIALSVVLGIMSFYLALLGLIIIMKRNVVNSKINWSLLALWLISVIVLSFTVPRYISNFRMDGKYTTVKNYDLHGKTAILRFNDIGEDQFELISLTIKPADDSVIMLEQNYYAKGKTREEAVENAKKIIYNVEVQDSVFLFNSMLNFGEGAGFRNQYLNMTLYIPKGQKFVIDENLKHLLGIYMYRQGYSNRMLRDNVWTFDEKGLKCITCPEPEESKADTGDKTSWDIKGYQRNYDVGRFTEVITSIPFTLYIKQGSGHELIINGPKDMVNDVIVDKTENTLSLDYRGPESIFKKRKENPVKIYIVVPELKAINLGGASRAYISGIEEDMIDIKMSGAAYAEMDIKTDYLDAEVDGAAKLRLTGQGEKLTAKISGASTLESYDFIADEVNIETRSASSARVYAKKRLTIDAKGASNVHYRGNASVEIEKTAGSRVTKD